MRALKFRQRCWQPQYRAVQASQLRARAVRGHPPPSGPGQVNLRRFQFMWMRPSISDPCLNVAAWPFRAAWPQQNLGAPIVREWTSEQCRAAQASQLKVMAVTCC